MPWRSRELCLQHVTINLPRAAYRGGRDGIADELGRIMPIVAAAHAQKYRLITRILEQGEAGPLALIARRREGACIHEVEHAVLHVGVIGLNECVRHCTGHQLHESEAAVAFGEEILESLRAQCDAWGEQAGLTFVATATTDMAVGKRLAGIDANHFATHTMAVIEPGDLDIQYTPGAETTAAAAITPGERVRCESGMHTRLHARPAVRIAIPDTDTSLESIAAFLLKTYRQTSVQRVRFE
jgi:ribonucleoside-triphosphate reductase